MNNKKITDFEIVEFDENRYFLETIDDGKNVIIQYELSRNDEDCLIIHTRRDFSCEPELYEERLDVIAGIESIDMEIPYKIIVYKARLYKWKDLIAPITIVLSEMIAHETPEGRRAQTSKKQDE